MAKSAKKSGGLAGKLGSKLKKAVDTHKQDETRTDTGGSLPAGIEGGVAQLVECKFDTVKEGKTNAGEYYFYAAGVVMAPKMFEGMRIEGARTSIMEMICDTPGRSRESVEEHVDWVLNEMRKLGLDTSELSAEDLEDAAEMLKKEQPFFRFRTWKGEKQTSGPYAGKEPRVNEVWQGVTEFEDEDTGDDVEEEETEVEDQEDQEEEEEEVDLEALATAADDEEDEQAAATLIEICKEQNVDHDAYDTWADVVEALSVEEEDDGEEEEEMEVEKGKECMYKGAGLKKAVKCTVTSSNKKAKTCTLKSATGKIYKGVNWSDLT